MPIVQNLMNFVIFSPLLLSTHIVNRLLPITLKKQKANALFSKNIGFSILYNQFVCIASGHLFIAILVCIFLHFT